MATVDPPAPDTPAHDDVAPHGGRRNWWMWACAGLAVVAIGLAVWGVGR